MKFYKFLIFCFFCLLISAFPAFADREICLRDAKTSTNYPTPDFITVDQEGAEPITPKKYPLLFSVSVQRSNYCLETAGKFDERQSHTLKLKKAKTKLKELHQYKSLTKQKITNKDDTQTDSADLNLTAEQLYQRLNNQKEILKFLQKIAADEEGTKLNVVENLSSREAEEYYLETVKKN